MNQEQFDACRAFISLTDTVMDIGAYDGTESRQLAAVAGRVVCVEAHPVACANILRARLPKNVTVHHVAICDRCGDVPFYMSRKADGGAWPASSSVRKPTTEERYPWLAFDAPVMVPGRTLDALCVELGIRPVFIHADIQGAERDLIEGGRETLKTVRAMSIEVSEGGNYEGAWGMNDMLAALGAEWRLVRQFGPDMVVCRVSDYAR